VVHDRFAAATEFGPGRSLNGPFDPTARVRTTPGLTERAKPRDLHCIARFERTEQKRRKDGMTNRAQQIYESRFRFGLGGVLARE
jgi:hypothetical protein